MSQSLHKVVTAADAAAMHAIRRATLFTQERHPGIVYDENHPADLDPANQRFLLMDSGQPIGVVRLDTRGADEGVVRLVAITPDLQRKGHGRSLMHLIDGEARARGMRKLMLNAHMSAIGFYTALGWRREVWDEGESDRAGCTQMVKAI